MPLKRRFSRKLRLGMVGGGRGGYIGSVHRTAAIMDGHWEMVAGALSRNPQLALDSALDWNIPADRAYSDYREMARIEGNRADRPDAIAVCTTNETHFEISKTFLEAGFNVICDKPLATEPEEAWELVSLAKRMNAVFAVCYCYSGYSMVRLARHMVACGDLGEIRSVVVEYASQYGTEREYGMPWLDDPARSGPSGVVAGTGTHACHLAEFISGLRIEELSADLSVLVDGHRLEDHATMHLRFEGGARGLLWNTSVATGNENGLSIRIFGAKGGLKWHQETPNALEFAPLKCAKRTLTPGGFETGRANKDWERVPCGHPEGYQEAFANLYAEIGESILERESETASPFGRYLYPTVEDGARGVEFVSAALASSQGNAVFVDVGARSTKTKEDLR